MRSASIVALALGYVAIWASWPASAAAPVAGSTIVNQAQATYIDPALGMNVRIVSNPVTATVSPVPGLSLVPNVSLNTIPGAPVSFVHQLCNTGNESETITLSFAPQSSDFALLNLQLYQDLNSNGVVDHGEPLIANGGTLALGYGECVSLILTGQTPPGTSSTPGGKSIDTLTATTTGVPPATVTDTAVVQSAAALMLTKSESVSTANPGDTVRYSLTLVNNGDQTATGETIFVDGQAQSSILIRDAIPANLQFGDIANTNGGEALYHVSGQGFDVYQTAIPSPLGVVDAVAFAFPPLVTGSTRTVSFDVLALPSAGGAINNTAEAYRGDATGSPIRTVSNTVSLTLPPAGAVLNYYNGGFTQVVSTVAAGTPVNLQATAGACNADPTRAESYPITLQAEKSGDVESGFVVRETGPNTGVFILTPVPTALTPPAVVKANDSIVQVTRNDYIDATLVCGGHTLRTRILVDPSGVVYDAITDVPVAGATVTIVFAGTNNSPPVLDFNGNPVPATVVTGADGVFQFPELPPGTYQLIVVPPAGYTFPSAIPPGSQPADRTVVNGSYGGTFVVSASGAVMFDVPLDPGSVKGGLHIQKKVSDPVVRVGESVVYTITVTNSVGISLGNVSVLDSLPVGFTYVPGSARLNGGPLGDPNGGRGPKLTFALGALDSGQQDILTYGVRVGAAVPDGNAINTAVAQSGSISSAPATAAVLVDRDVFSDQGYILGKVFVDCNGDRVQGPDEIGIPGVRIVMDNGDYAITDEEGKYSLYDISPRTHVVKVDSETLPAGAEMRTTGNRNAGDPKSLFADIKRGELYRADFAEGSCTPALLQEVKARRSKGEVFAAELNLKPDEIFSASSLAYAQIDPRTRPASGTLDPGGRIVPYRPVLFDRPTSRIDEQLGSAKPVAPPSVKLETILPTIADNELGFMDLSDGQTFASRNVSIRVKGPAGTRFVLNVDGDVVPESRVGQRAVMATRNVEAWEYIAVRLVPGSNTINLSAVDPFGNIRGSRSIKVIAPGDLGRIEVETPPAAVEADGQTPVTVVVRLTDEHGVRISARTAVTLESTLGRWQVKDLDPDAPGVQTFIEGGEGHYQLIPPDAPGEARIRASSGLLKQDAVLAFTPHLRPLIAAGVVEGAFGFSKLKADQLAPASPQDGFEEDIQDLSHHGGDSTAGVRGSMYLKGKIKGDFLLTLAYDSDKNKQDPLFRDIDPEKFYPVYGDSAVKGFDAQSTTKLYVRIDKGRNYVLYGDFNTGAGYINQNSDAAQQGTGGQDAVERRLSNYQRSLTGARTHLENRFGSFNAFGSYDSRDQEVAEFRGQGISGPYPLNFTDLLINSEQVDIITRDRNQPAIVISDVTLTQITDYTLNPLDGTILFTKAIPSVDSNLNPVFVRVVFEVNNGGDKAWVYGADGQLNVLKNLQIGGAYAHDDTPLKHYTLSGADTVWKINHDSYVVAEGAQSQSDDRGNGSAGRVEWVEHGKDLEAKVYAERATDNFENPTSGLSSGHIEAGVKALYKLTEKLSAGVHALYTHDDVNSTVSSNTQALPYGQSAINGPLTAAAAGSRGGALGFLDYAITARMTLEVGIRRAVGNAEVLTTATPPTGPSESTSILVKDTWRPSWLPKGSFSAGYEQDVLDAHLREAEVGGDYQLADRMRLYARHEFLSSLDSVYALTSGTNYTNSTVVGVDYDYLKNANLFSEYRVRDEISGRESEASTGLRNQWTLGSLRISSQLERVQPMSTNAQQNTAVALGAEYLINPLTKATGRFEWRTAQAEHSYFNTLALARKLSLDWTFLAKNAWSYTTNSENDLHTLRDRYRLGLAYRNTDSNRWLWLGTYETRYDRDEVLDENRFVHVLSTHFNFHPSRAWVFDGRLAGKYAHEVLGGTAATNTSAALLFGRATYDITDRWDVGVLGSVLIDNSVANREEGFGAEVGYLVGSNLWMSAGFNLLGYQEKDLAESDYINKGAFLRLRFKFDEDLFQWMQ